MHPNGYSGYGLDDLEDESQAASSGNESENDWKGGDDDENEVDGDDEGEERGTGPEGECWALGVKSGVVCREKVG
jgi:hypothetical protein